MTIEIAYDVGICGEDIRFGMPVVLSIHGTLVECQAYDPKAILIGLASRSIKQGESVRIGAAHPDITFDIITKGAVVWR